VQEELVPKELVPEELAERPNDNQDTMSGKKSDCLQYCLVDSELNEQDSHANIYNWENDTVHAASTQGKHAA